jgi:hypothetical protein
MEGEKPMNAPNGIPAVVETRLAAALSTIEYGKLTVTFHEGQIVSIVTEERRRLLPQGDESVSLAIPTFKLRSNL